jgi:rhodanese-related sulfurtransferase
MRHVFPWLLVLLVAMEIGVGFDKIAVTDSIRLAFPEVSQVPTDSLLSWQSRTQGVSPVLLDVREPVEFSVSHIKGAKSASTKWEALNLLKDMRKDTLVVLYCSVGYRSSELAKKLEAGGFTNVHNLEGSIFEWANRGFPLYRDDERVNVVHPFDEKWGRLLNRSLWATTPDTSDTK